MEQEQKERIIKKLEELNEKDVSAFERIVRILLKGVWAGIHIEDLLCAYEGDIIEYILSGISGDLWEKTYIWLIIFTR